jgi:hypothetical protein
VVPSVHTLLKIKGGGKLPGLIDADASDSEQDKGLGSDQIWHGHSQRIRTKLEMPHDEVVWTDTHLLVGVPNNPRAMDTVQVSYWDWLRKHPSRSQREGPVDWFVDTSQGVERHHWGPNIGCFLKDSSWYSFRLDRVLDSEDR